MGRKPRKPAKLKLDPVTAYPRRGPREGRWYWQAVRREGGKQITVWTGWGTRDEVRRTLAALVAEAGIPAPSTVRTAGRLSTVRDLLECHQAALEAREDISPFTVRNRRTSGVRLLKQLDGLALDRLCADVLERYRDVSLRKGAATATVQNDLKTLRHAWTWARRHGYVTDRALPSIRLNVKPSREKYTPSEEEVAAVLKHLSGWARMAVLIMAGTGARIGAVAELTWDRVDLDRGEIHFIGKTRRRTVPILSDLLRELQAWPGKPGRAEVLGVGSNTVRSLNGKYLGDACIAAGVPHFSPHGLRRLACDRLYRVAGPDVAAEILGHSVVVAMRYYRQVSAAEKRVALEAAFRAPSRAGKVYSFTAEK